MEEPSFSTGSALTGTLTLTVQLPGLFIPAGRRILALLVSFLISLTEVAFTGCFAKPNFYFQGHCFFYVTPCRGKWPQLFLERELVTGSEGPAQHTMPVSWGLQRCKAQAPGLSLEPGTLGV